MINETMTVHEALSELKMLDKRIRASINRSTLCVSNKHSNQKIGGKSIEDFKQEAKSSYESIKALIRRRSAIRNALSVSNAKTIVTIGGVEYSIAEAIEMKNTGVDNYRVLLEHMSYQMTSACNDVIRGNGDTLQKKADDYVAALYGSKDKGVDADTIANAREAYVDANTIDFIDPIDVKREIDRLDAFIEQFKAEVDSKISISNALTSIEISYE